MTYPFKKKSHVANFINPYFENNNCKMDIVETLKNRLNTGHLHTFIGPGVLVRLNFPTNGNNLPDLVTTSPINHKDVNTDAETVEQKKIDDPAKLHFKSQFKNYPDDNYNLATSSNNTDWQLLPPHVKSIALSAHERLKRGMKEENNHSRVEKSDLLALSTTLQLCKQCIRLSGDSGSGKTHCLWQLIDYFSLVNRSHSNIHDNHLADKLANCRIILESLGNISAPSNPSGSSRFTNITVLQFNRDGLLIGAHVKALLLERERVVKSSEHSKRAPDVCNFHVFQQLVSGANSDEEMKQAFHIDDAQPFKFLSRGAGGMTRVAHVLAAAKYQRLCEALVSIGLNEEDIHSISRFLMGILHLGEIDLMACRNLYLDSTNGATRASAISNKESIDNNNKHLRLVSDLWGIDVMDFCSVLNVSSSLNVGVNISHQSGKASIREMELRCHWLAASVYDAIFQWIVSKINNCLSCSSRLEADESYITRGQIYIIDGISLLPSDFSDESGDVSFSNGVQEEKEHIGSLESLRRHFLDELLQFKCNQASISSCRHAFMEISSLSSSSIEGEEEAACHNDNENYLLEKSYSTDSDKKDLTPRKVTLAFFDYLFEKLSTQMQLDDLLSPKSSSVFSDVAGCIMDQSIIEAAVKVTRSFLSHPRFSGCVTPSSSTQLSSSPSKVTSFGLRCHTCSFKSTRKSSDNNDSVFLFDSSKLLSALQIEHALNLWTSNHAVKLFKGTPLIEQDVQHKSSRQSTLHSFLHVRFSNENVAGDDNAMVILDENNFCKTSNLNSWRDSFDAIRCALSFLESPEVDGQNVNGCRISGVSLFVQHFIVCITPFRIPQQQFSGESAGLADLERQLNQRGVVSLNSFLTNDLPGPVTMHHKEFVSTYGFLLTLQSMTKICHDGKVDVLVKSRSSRPFVRSNSASRSLRISCEELRLQLLRLIHSDQLPRVTTFASNRDGCDNNASSAALASAVIIAIGRRVVYLQVTTRQFLDRYVERRRSNAASCVQAYVRNVYLVRQKYLRGRWAVLRIQGLFRKQSFKKKVLSKVLPDRWNPLHDAAYKGDLDLLVKLTSSGASINERTEDGSSVLHVFCMAVNRPLLTATNALSVLSSKEHSSDNNVIPFTPSKIRDIVRRMVAMGVSVNVRDAKLRTALHVAVTFAAPLPVPTPASGHYNAGSSSVGSMQQLLDANVELLQSLIDCGVDPSLRDCDGNNFLHIAASRDYLAPIASYVDLYNRDMTNALGDSYLTLSAKNGFDQNEVFKYLLDRDICNINAVNKDGKSAFAIACDNNLECDVGKVLSMLQKHSGSPLSFSHVETFLAFFQNVLNIFSRPCEEAVRAPASSSIAGRDRDPSSYLRRLALEATLLFIALPGLDLNVRDVLKMPPMMKLCTCPYVGRVVELEHILSALLQAGASPNLQDYQGRTALMLATINRKELVSVLLSSPLVDVSIQDIYGFNPPHYAFHHGHLDLLYAFGSRGIDLLSSTGTGSRTLLHMAVEANQLLVVDHLLRHKADTNIPDGQGRTVLMLACRLGDLALVQLLIQHGASKNIAHLNVSRSGSLTSPTLSSLHADSVLHLSLQCGHLKIAQWLLFQSGLYEGDDEEQHKSEMAGLSRIDAPPQWILTVADVLTDIRLRRGLPAQSTLSSRGKLFSIIVTGYFIVADQEVSAMILSNQSSKFANANANTSANVHAIGTPSTTAVSPSTPGAESTGSGGKDKYVVYETKVIINGLYKEIFDPEFCIQESTFYLRYEQMKRLNELLVRQGLPTFRYPKESISKMDNVNSIASALTNKISLESLGLGNLRSSLPKMYNWNDESFILFRMEKFNWWFKKVVEESRSNEALSAAIRMFMTENPQVHETMRQFINMKKCRSPSSA